MMQVNKILWYGPPPLPGIRERLELRGFAITLNPKKEDLVDGVLAVTKIVVLNHDEDSSDCARAGYKSLRSFVDHGVRLLVIGGERVAIRKNFLDSLDPKYPWDDAVRFLPHLQGIHFDNFINGQDGYRWRQFTVEQIGNFEKLTDEDKRLIQRAFDKAEEVDLRVLRGGFTGSRVFTAYEKRRDNETSLAHWAQPLLVKIGDRSNLSSEVAAMKTVSPFVPFELRPNLLVYVEGLRRAVYVADFVEKSESMLDAARAGRAETAISNLFNRTLFRWRDRAKQCEPVQGSLIEAAERFEIAKPALIQSEYLESERIQRLGTDVSELWSQLAEIQFAYRAATIHGDLHGDNVRVRGDDAILIDLGAVKGDTRRGEGVPLCFDVAMLEVALVFAYRGEEDGENEFEQPEWEDELRPFYQLHAIQSSPSIDKAPEPDSWLFGCLQRIRAFGIYEQSDPYEYPIALVVALFRWCKFPPGSRQLDADKGRRVVALEIGIKLIQEILGKKNDKSGADTR